MTAGPAPLLLALQQLPDDLPVAGPWDTRARIGAAVYVLLFLVALLGVRRLLAGGPAADDEATMTP